MFKISIVDTRAKRTLVVEGTLIGPWIAELRTAWRNASQELDGRKLVIHLSNLTALSRGVESMALQRFASMMSDTTKGMNMKTSSPPSRLNC